MDLKSDPTAPVLLLGVAGLGVSGALAWGEDGHPGAFLLRLGASLPTAAVACLDYPAQLKAFAAQPQLSVEQLALDLAEVLARQLLPHHGQLVFVSHCLGGLLVTSALRRLFDAHRGEPARCRAWARQMHWIGLDVPHAWPSAGPSPWLAELLRVLRLNEAQFAANGEFWQRWVLAPTGAAGLRAHAVVSEAISWVSDLKPWAELPPQQVSRVCLPHETMVLAPPVGPHEALDAVRRLLTPRASVGGVPGP